MPAAMAWAAFLRASREGDGPFYRRAMEGRWVWASWKAVYWGRRGRGGRSQARGVAAILVARAGEEKGRGELRGAGEGGLGQYQGRGSGLELRCDAWGGQVAAPAYGSGRRHGSGKREVEETVSGNFVIRPKFQNSVL